MACSHHNFLIVTVASQLLPERGEFESMAVEAKEGQRKIRPHRVRDSVRVDPEHVWGDEAPGERVARLSEHGYKDARLLPGILQSPWQACNRTRESLGTSKAAIKPRKRLLNLG